MRLAARSRIRLAGTLLAASFLSPHAAGAQIADSASPAPGHDQERRAEQHRPNILVWMLDDVGFSQLASFGGLVATPNIDRIVARGTRYANYHTTPICSASRAAFLTGRNSHHVHMGGHPIFPSDRPGYDARIPASAGTLAENLRQAGYATFALGKWDHLPLRDVTPSGPQTYWPLGQGFEHFYGFLASEIDNFHPSLWRDNTPVELPQGGAYHLNADLADHAIDMIRSRDGQAQPRPFFMYFATGTAHAPHHAPRDWIERYRGKFDEGWDVLRARVLKWQIAQGIVPSTTRLASRPAGMPAWDSLSRDDKRLFARQMEVYAAAIGYADMQFGRVLDELERRHELDNTVVLVTSDNGASAEGGLAGSYNELFFAKGAQPTAAENRKRYDQWGGPETFPHYAFGWAVAGNTPFRYYKQTTYEGGVRVPLILAVPGVAHRDGWVESFVHVADVTPTLLDLAQVKPAAMVNDTRQSSFDGISFATTVSTSTPATEHPDQYFEMFGHKAFWSAGWKIVSPSRLDTWDISAPAKLHEPWQLYDLRSDPGETSDVAARNPALVARLAGGFDAAARRFDVLPIAGAADGVAFQARQDAADLVRREGRWLYNGPIARIPKQVAPPFDRSAFTATAELDLPDDGATGPIFALGGRFGGAAFYLADGKPGFIVRALDGTAEVIASPEAVGRGRQSLVLKVSAPEQGARRIAIERAGRELVSGSLDIAVPPVVPETFDIGSDEATPVTDAYREHARLQGSLQSLTFQLPVPSPGE